MTERPQERRPKLLFLTDSLGEPRLSPEPIYDDQVWPRLVASHVDKRYDCYFFSRPGLHTGGMRENLAVQLGAYRPDIIALQIGIVDCSPRAMRENERKVIARLPGPLRTTALRLIRENYARLIAWRDITYVSEPSFRENLDALRAHFVEARFIALPIGLANTAYKQRNPLIERNITRYNQALADVFGADYVAETFDGVDIEQFYLSDNHHLSARGHQVYADAVMRRLDALSASA